MISLARIVRQLGLPRDVHVDDWDIVQDTDAVRLRIWTWPGEPTKANRHSYRSAVIQVDGDEIRRAKRDPRWFVGVVEGRLKTALAQLFPPPPPTFRIGRGPRRLTSRAKRR